VKNCVVVLANNSRRNELNNLIKVLNLYIIEGTDDFDLIIFHEKNFIKDEINDFLGKGELLFHEINFDINQFNSYKTNEIPLIHHGYGIGYRMMCRFFAGEVFKILKQYDYDYMMRLDTDSSFYDQIKYNLFDKLKIKNGIYGYVSIHNDAVEFSNELVLNIHEYVQNKHTNINFYKVIKNQFNLVYYNNFEILKISEYTNENYLSFYEYLDSKNGFLKYRWGDHAVRFLYNNLFIKQEQIIYYNDLPYFHHFDLKNRPFILNNYF
jgi:hypothetical protein